MLKLCILFAILAAAIAEPPPPMPAEMVAAKETCQKKEPTVSEEIISSMCQPGFTTTDEKVKCFALCMGQALGYTDAKGKIDKAAVLKKPPPFVEVAKLSPILDECIALTGTTDCDTAYLQMQCLHKAAPAQG